MKGKRCDMDFDAKRGRTNRKSKGKDNREKRKKKTVCYFFFISLDA